MTVSNLGKAVRELESGRPKITGLPQFLEGIKFNDGTTQTTAFTGGGYTAITSSYTRVPAFTQTQGAHNVAIATVTITATANPVFICFAGSAENTGANYCSMNFLIDGDRYPGTSGLIGVVSGPALAQAVNFSLCLPHTVTAGSHSFAVTFATTGNSCVNTAGSLNINHFGVFQ